LADFDKDTTDYGEQVKAKNKLELHQEQIISSNNQMVADFTAKYGEDEFKTIWAEIQKYINPKVFKNIDPYPKDALEIFRKGMNYDADIEKAKKEAVITKEKERQAKSEKGTVIIKNKNTPKPKETSSLPDRFNVIEN